MVAMCWYSDWKEQAEEEAVCDAGVLTFRGQTGTYIYNIFYKESLEIMSLVTIQLPKRTHIIILYIPTYLSTTNVQLV